MQCIATTKYIKSSSQRETFFLLSSTYDELTSVYILIPKFIFFLHLLIVLATFKACWKDFLPSDSLRV